MGRSQLGQTTPNINEDKSSFTTFKEVFNKEFPYALALGMNYEEYWYEDVSLLNSYLKAQEIKNQIKNSELYLQAAYQYDVLCRVAPLYNAMKPSKPQPFLDSPYPLTKEEIDAKEYERKLRIMEELKGSLKVKSLKIYDKLSKK